MQMQIDQLEKDIIPDEKIRNYIDVLIKDNRISAMKIYSLENDVKLLKQRSVDAHRISGSNDALILEKMSEIDQFLVEYRQKTETLVFIFCKLSNSPTITYSIYACTDQILFGMTLNYEMAQIIYKAPRL